MKVSTYSLFEGNFVVKCVIRGKGSQVYPTFYVFAVGCLLFHEDLLFSLEIWNEKFGWKHSSLKKGSNLEFQWFQAVKPIKMSWKGEFSLKNQLWNRLNQVTICFQFPRSFFIATFHIKRTKNSVTTHATIHKIQFSTLWLWFLIFPCSFRKRSIRK